MKLNTLVLTLLLLPCLLPACTEKEYTATAIVVVLPEWPEFAVHDVPPPEHEIRKQAALLTSLSTIRKTVEGKRFHQWQYYHGHTAEQVARQILPRVRTRVLPETGLVELSCTHPAPDLAPRIVNAIIAMVIEDQREHARSLLKKPIREWEDESEITRARIDHLRIRFGTRHPEFSTHREMVLEFDRLRQSLLTFSGKLDQLALTISTAAPLAEAIQRAGAEGGPGLASLYGVSELTRLSETRDLTVNLNTARSELEALQAYLAPEHPQVQAAMARITDLEARLANFRDSWLLGKKADYEALLAHRDRVTEMQQAVAATARRLAVVMAEYDDAEKQRLGHEQRLTVIDARLDELHHQLKVVRAGIELIEPAARPRSHN